MKTISLALAALLTACAASSFPAPEVPDCASRTSHVAFSGDTSFTEEERAAIQGASSDLFGFSTGRMTAWIEWRGVKIAYEPHIYRVLSTDDVVKRQDALAEKTYKVSGFKHAGWESGQSIYLVIDRITDVRYTTTHELGHALGLRWPGCDSATGEDCFHTDDANAIMCGFPRTKSCGSGSKSLGAGDLEFCRASCLCD